MSYVEVVVEIIVGQSKSGADKKVKESYLVDADSVTEAESRVIKDFTESGAVLDFRVISTKESKIIRIIE